MYSVTEDRANTLANLSRAIELNDSYKDMAKNDEYFKTLWEDLDFKRIVA